MSHFNRPTSDFIVAKLLLHVCKTSLKIYGTVLDWFRSYVTDPTQSTLIMDKKIACASRLCPLPILYLLYTAPPTHTVQHHRMQFHFYAEDTYLHISFTTNKDLQLTNNISKIDECSTDLDKWISQNKLNFNKDKTEILHFYSKYNPQQSTTTLLRNRYNSGSSIRQKR